MINKLQRITCLLSNPLKFFEISYLVTLAKMSSDRFRAYLSSLALLVELILKGAYHYHYHHHSYHYHHQHCRNHINRNVSKTFVHACFLSSDNFIDALCRIYCTVHWYSQKWFQNLKCWSDLILLCLNYSNTARAEM